MKTFLLILLACLASLAVVESQFNLDIGTGLGLLALKVNMYIVFKSFGLPLLWAF